MVHCRFTAGHWLIIVVSGNSEAPLERGLRTHANDDPGEVLDVFPGVIGDRDGKSRSVFFISSIILPHDHMPAALS
jgi:hypothetical protein